MEWELWIAGASAVGAALAAVFAGWQSAEARKARKDADASAKQVAAAQKEIAQAVRDLKPPRSAVWRVTHLTGDKYALTNVGGETALDVRVTTDSYREPQSRFTRIQDRSEEQIWYVGYMGCKRQIHITWHHPEDAMDDAPHEWNGFVPPKPR